MTGDPCSPPPSSMHIAKDPSLVPKEDDKVERHPHLSEQEMMYSGTPMESSFYTYQYTNPALSTSTTARRRSPSLSANGVSDSGNSHDGVGNEEAEEEEMAARKPVEVPPPELQWLHLPGPTATIPSSVLHGGFTLSSFSGHGDEKTPTKTAGSSLSSPSPVTFYQWSRRDQFWRQYHAAQRVRSMAAASPSFLDGTAPSSVSSPDTFLVDVLVSMEPRPQLALGGLAAIQLPLPSSYWKTFSSPTLPMDVENRDASQGSSALVMKEDVQGTSEVAINRRNEKEEDSSSVACGLNHPGNPHCADKMKGTGASPPKTCYSPFLSRIADPPSHHLFHSFFTVTAEEYALVMPSSISTSSSFVFDYSSSCKLLTLFERFGNAVLVRDRWAYTDATGMYPRGWPLPAKNKKSWKDKKEIKDEVGVGAEVQEQEEVPSVEEIHMHYQQLTCRVMAYRYDLLQRVLQSFSSPLPPSSSSSTSSTHLNSPTAPHGHPLLSCARSPSTMPRSSPLLALSSSSSSPFVDPLWWEAMQKHPFFSHPLLPSTWNGKRITPRGEKGDPATNASFFTSFSFQHSLPSRADLHRFLTSNPTTALFPKNINKEEEQTKTFSGPHCGMDEAHEKIATNREEESEERRMTVEVRDEEVARNTTQEPSITAVSIPLHEKEEEKKHDTPQKKLLVTNRSWLSPMDVTFVEDWSSIRRKREHLSALLALEAEVNVVRTKARLAYTALLPRAREVLQRASAIWEATLPCTPDTNAGVSPLGALSSSSMENTGLVRERWAPSLCTSAILEDGETALQDILHRTAEWLHAQCHALSMTTLWISSASPLSSPSIARVPSHQDCSSPSSASTPFSPLLPPPRTLFTLEPSLSLCCPPTTSPKTSGQGERTGKQARTAVDGTNLENKNDEEKEDEKEVDEEETEDGNPKKKRKLDCTRDTEDEEEEERSQTRAATHSVPSATTTYSIVPVDCRGNSRGRGGRRKRGRGRLTARATSGCTTRRATPTSLSSSFDAPTGTAFDRRGDVEEKRKERVEEDEEVVGEECVSGGIANRVLRSTPVSPFTQPPTTLSSVCEEVGDLLPEWMFRLERIAQAGWLLPPLAPLAFPTPSVVTDSENDEMEKEATRGVEMEGLKEVLAHRPGVTDEKGSAALPCPTTTMTARTAGVVSLAPFLEVPSMEVSPLIESKSSIGSAAHTIAVKNEDEEGPPRWQRRDGGGAPDEDANHLRDDGKPERGGIPTRRGRGRGRGRRRGREEEGYVEAAILLPLVESEEGGEGRRTESGRGNEGVAGYTSREWPPEPYLRQLKDVHGSGWANRAHSHLGEAVLLSFPRTAGIPVVFREVEEALEKHLWEDPYALMEGDHPAIAALISEIRLLLLQNKTSRRHVQRWESRVLEGLQKIREESEMHRQLLEEDQHRRQAQRRG